MLCTFKVGYKAATGVRHSVHFPAAKGGAAVIFLMVPEGLSLRGCAGRVGFEPAGGGAP